MKNITPGEWLPTLDPRNEENWIICIPTNNTVRTIATIHKLSTYHGLQDEANAEAICKAVNNTYGYRSEQFPNGIDPEETPNALEKIQSIAKTIIGSTSTAGYEILDALESIKL